MVFSRIFPSIMKGTAGMEIKCGSSWAVVGEVFVSDSSSNNLRLGISCVVLRTGENKLGGELRLSTDERALRRKNQQCTQIRSAILIAERTSEAKRRKETSNAQDQMAVVGSQADTLEQNPRGGTAQSHSPAAR